MTTEGMELKRSLAKSGRRMTRQREAVYQTVLQYKDHPTAEEVFARVRSRIPEISLATVYNSLEALAETGHLQKVPRIDDAPARYDHLSDPHHHMRCVDCGKVWNIGSDGPPVGPQMFNLTDKLQAVGYVVEVRVKCPVECPLCARRSGPAK